MVGALLTVTDAGLVDTLGRKSALPPKEATTESAPTGNVVVSMLADVTPSVVVNVEVPSAVPSTLKVTEPSGMAAPVTGVTVAVNVTL